METYKPSPDNEAKRNAGIAFPLPLWEQIMKAAAEEYVTASHWVRMACREKLERS